MTDYEAKMLIALIRSKIVGNYILVSKQVFDWFVKREEKKEEGREE